MIASDLLRHYRAEGYVIARNVLPLGELDRATRDMAALFTTQLHHLGVSADESGTREAFYANAMALLRHDVGRYIATARMTQDLPSVHRILTSETILDLVRDFGLQAPVVSTKPSVHLMADDLKIPNGYHKTPPHQDWRSMQGSLDSIILWIPATPVSVSSNALEVVPRSHRLGLLDTVEHIMTPTVSDPRITEASFVPLAVEPGDIIFFSSFLVHRTGEQGDGLVRIALSTRFNNAVEATFVERGYPTPYKYSYRLDLMFADFPSADDVDALFSEKVSA